MTDNLSQMSSAIELAAPDGPALVRWLSADPKVRDRQMTDGRHTISYAEVGTSLDRLDARFTGSGLAPDHPVALECSQSVVGALALLYLLGRQYDVVLLPELGESAKEAGTPRFIPSFCSHVVTAAPRSASDGPDLPEDGILVADHSAFAEEPAIAEFSGPDLYLRTSGSTGVPKLTRMSHQKWLNNAAACVERWGLSADDRLSVPVPIFHSYGFGAAFLPGLLAGASMDFGSGGNILRYLEREQRFAPNVAFLTPALCDMFLAVRKSPRLYRLVVTAGDKVKRETMIGFEPSFGPLLNLYGSAEMGAVSAAAPDEEPARRLATAGYPLAGIELRVVDTEAEDAPFNLSTTEGSGGERIGLLECRQRNGSAGYLIQEERWRFLPRGDDEWFPTGDLARIRADGYLEVLGRSGLSVKRDGLLVVFADVESAVEKIEGVERAVVVAAGESRRGPRLVAACLGRKGADLNAETVRKRCFDLLPRYAVPDEVLVIESLPTLPSGKIDRRAVRERMLILSPPSASR